MAELPLNVGISRLKANEDRINTFANGLDTESYAPPSGGTVPSLRKFLKETRAEIATETAGYFEEASQGLITQIETNAGIAVSAKDTSVAAATVAVNARDDAIDAKEDSIAAAEASGVWVAYDTKGAATAAVAGLPANQIVEVQRDESRGGARTRYRKESGSLVFKAVLDARTVVHLAEFGGGVAMTGAENAAALEAAWSYLVTANQGGVIELPPGNLDFDNSALEETTKRITIRGAGRTSTIITPSDPGGVSSFMWEIGAAGTPSLLSLHGFTVQGNSTTRTSTGGILLHESNNVEADSVAFRHLIGTGLKAERAHNSYFNVVTYKCGSLADGKFAQVYTGDPNTTGTDAVVNDLRFGPQSTTEQDELGIQISYAANVWGAGIIKLHGSTTSYRALEMYRVNNFNLTVMPTQAYGQNGYIYIGDNGGVDLPNFLPYDPGTIGGQTCFGILRVIPLNNLTNTLGGQEAVIEIDTNNVPGLVSIEGIMPEINGADYRLIHFTATTGSSAKTDLSRLQARGADESKWIRDERTLQKNYSAEQFTRKSGVQLGVRTKLRGNSLWEQRLSETSLMELPANAAGPALRGLAAAFTGTRGTIVHGPQPLVFSFCQTFAATTMVVGAAGFQVPDDGTTAGRAVIREIKVGTIGVGPWSGTDFWTLRMYNGTNTEDLILGGGKTFAVDGAGFPDVARLVASVHRRFDYWSTPSTYREFTAASILRFELIKSGAPADISNLQIAVFYDMGA